MIISSKRASHFASLTARYSGDGRLAMWEHRAGAPAKIPEHFSEERLVLVLDADTYAAIREFAARNRDGGAISSAPALVREWLALYEASGECLYNPKSDDRVRADFRDHLKNSPRMRLHRERNLTTTISALISPKLAEHIRYYAAMKAQGDHKSYLLKAMMQKAMNGITGTKYGESGAPRQAAA
jgi:hypothetical protein